MRLLVLITGLALVIAACGGDSGDEPSETTAADSPDTTAAPEEEDAPAATTTTAAPADSGDAESAGGDVSTGSVTVAGQTYEFLDAGFPGIQCDPDAFGVAFLVALQSAEENDGVIGSLSMGIPFPGEEETAGIVPTIRASDGEVEWIADPEHADLNSIPPGSSQVDSYEIDGNTVSGTATFYERDSSFTGNADDLIVETGTFEVTCVES